MAKKRPKKPKRPKVPKPKQPKGATAFLKAAGRARRRAVKATGDDRKAYAGYARYRLGRARDLRIARGKVLP